MQDDLARSHDCETAGPAIREQLGCDKSLPDALCFKVDEIKIDRCPAYYLKGASLASVFLEMHNWREKGILPFKGGYLEQPNKIVEALNYIDYLFGLKLKNLKK